MCQKTKDTSCLAGKVLLSLSGRGSGPPIRQDPARGGGLCRKRPPPRAAASPLCILVCACREQVLLEVKLNWRAAVPTQVHVTCGCFPGLQDGAEWLWQRPHGPQDTNTSFLALHRTGLPIPTRSNPAPAISRTSRHVILVTPQRVWEFRSRRGEPWAGMRA